MGELAYVNGTYCPIEEAVVSIEDRGFQFGDGIYEVIAVYNGRPFQLDGHLRRLERSAEMIALDLDVEAMRIEPIVIEGVRRSGLTDVYVYIQITRGCAPRAHAVPEGLSPTVVMTFKPLVPLSIDVREKGIAVMTTPDLRWRNCCVKAITLLPNVLAKSEAVRRGYDDALFVSDDGHVREATSGNVFTVRDSVIHTPPRDERVLHGITQSFIMACAETIGLRFVETHLPLDEMMQADEVFVSSTAVEVLAVRSIDDRPIAGGKVGPVTTRLHLAFQDGVRRNTAPSIQQKSATA